MGVDEKDIPEREIVAWWAKGCVVRTQAQQEIVQKIMEMHEAFAIMERRR